MNWMDEVKYDEERYEDLTSAVTRCRELGYAIDTLVINSALFSDPALRELLGKLQIAHREVMHYLEAMKDEDNVY